MARCSSAATDARVDAAGQAADDLGVADLRADGLDGVVDDVDHRPQRRDARDVVQEASDDVLAVLGVRDLRVELRRVELALVVLHRGDTGGGRTRGDRESRRRGAHGVAVAHPDLRGLGQAVEQRAARLGHGELGESVLADVGLGNVAAQVQRHLLDAVAETQDGDAQLEDGRIHVRRALGVHARRTAREDHRRRRAARDLLGRDVERHDLRVDPGLADATRDELRVLRPEVEDEDRRLCVVLELRHASGPSRRPGSSAASCPRSGATGRP